MYSKTIIVGRLGRDPELRYNPAGEAVCSFSVATDRTWTDASGQRQSKVTWRRVSVWGRQAVSCNEYLRKGRAVLCEGTEEARCYQAKDGQWRASLELTARNVKFLGGRSEGEQRETQEAPRSSTPPMVDEEEIPFP